MEQNAPRPPCAHALLAQSASLAHVAPNVPAAASAPFVPPPCPPPPPPLAALEAAAGCADVATAGRADAPADAAGASPFTAVGGAALEVGFEGAAAEAEGVAGATSSLGVPDVFLQAAPNAMRATSPNACVRVIIVAIVPNSREISSSAASPCGCVGRPPPTPRARFPDTAPRESELAWRARAEKLGTHLRPLHSPREPSSL